MRANFEFSPEQAREVGKSYFFNSDGDSRTLNLPKNKSKKEI